MATSISGKAGAVFDLIYNLDVDISEDLKAQLKIEASRWSYGTGANQVNVIYTATTTLTDGSNTTLNLKDSGSLLDIFKQALTMTAIKFVYIKFRSTDSVLKIGGGASLDLDIFAATSDILLLKTNGVFIWTDPSAAGVDVTTNKNLKLEDDASGAAGNKPVDVIIMGLD